jgi:hypothetical protein
MMMGVSGDLWGKRGASRDLKGQSIATHEQVIPDDPGFKRFSEICLMYECVYYQEHFIMSLTMTHALGHIDT